MAANYFRYLGLVLFSSLATTSIANTEEKPAAPSTASWQMLSQEQRRELLNSYQLLHQLDDKDRQDLQQRMDWFSQLPKEQQQRMREVWQNMSASEREYWKNQLKDASAEQRIKLREKILEKYD
ncbi:DUF3106 domain-containing protein [Alkanindiges sp. WGS2144]|uniref:DUF3106 domain-containing protein n=1 Tax=Alkanindiges sp. WGS2144 TaxID=3366808 RepID=UPI0037530CF6